MDKIVGFIVCTMNEYSIEVRQAYIDDENSALFGALVLKVSNVYDTMDKKKNIYICAVNEASNNMVRKVFDGMIISQERLISARA